MPRTDLEACRSALEAKLGTELTALELAHDGVNRTLIAESESPEPAYVIRLAGAYRESLSFHDIAEEYRVLTRLHRTDLPVPEPVLLCEDRSILGAPFLVVRYVDGQNVPLGDDLPQRFQRPAARREVASALIDTLAEIHTTDIDRVSDLCERRPLRAHVERILAQLEAAIRVTNCAPPALTAVIEWTRTNIPQGSTLGLVHGDYRPSNVLLRGDATPRIAAVVDWETAFLGDPLTELGYFLVRWRDEGDPTVNLEDLGRRYARPEIVDELRERNDWGLSPMSTAAGSPNRRELVDRYEDRTGRRFNTHRFYRVFGALVLITAWADLDRMSIERGERARRQPHVAYVSGMAKLIADGEWSL